MLQSEDNSTTLFHRCGIMFLSFRKAFTKVGNYFYTVRLVYQVIHWRFGLRMLRLLLHLHLHVR